MPAVTEEDGDLGPIPRRTKYSSGFGTGKTSWWRPRSTFGRALLGTVAVLVLGGVVAGGIVTRNFLTRDAHFRIPGAASIQSSGLSEVNRAEVLPVFGEDIGRNIFFVPLGERRKQLEAIPWVQQATVMRFLPDRLSVSIVERTPVAFVRQGGQVDLADADGVILKMPPAMMAQHHYSFPVVTGIQAQDSLGSRRARMAVYLRFVAELDQSGQHLTQQVSEIDLSDSEDLRAVMPEQGSDILAHFGEDQFLKRLQTYKAHIGEWRGRYPKLIGVDLRYNGEVPLEMATGAEGAGAATGKLAVVGGDAAEKPAAKVPGKTPASVEAKVNKPLAHVVAAKPVPVSSSKMIAAAHKAADRKRKAAQLKAAGAAHAKHLKESVKAHAAVHAVTHTASGHEQGQ